MKKETPLAERMRPRSLDQFIGQEHLVGEGQVLRTLIEKKQIPSMIFWGPPGVGKTTLAQIISRELGMTFFTLSAISSGVKEVREVIDTAKKAGKAILFIDEIQRYIQLQQLSLKKYKYAHFFFIIKDFTDLRRKYPSNLPPKIKSYLSEFENGYEKLTGILMQKLLKGNSN